MPKAQRDLEQRGLIELQWPCARRSVRRRNICDISLVDRGPEEKGEYILCAHALMMSPYGARDGIESFRGVEVEIHVRSGCRASEGWNA